MRKKAVDETTLMIMTHVAFLGEGIVEWRYLRAPLGNSSRK